MKIGFISTAFPLDLHRSVLGWHQRMGMFIHAMKDMGELDMLFYVPPELPVNEHFVAEMEEKLSIHWDAQLRLDLCNQAPPKPAKGRWRHYISPALSILDHPPYLQIGQREQVSAVRRMLSRKPDILFVHRLTGMIPVLLSGESHPRIYFDLDDVEHVAYSRYIKQPPWYPGKRLYYLRLPILRLWERRAIRLSSTTFVCSEHDRHYLSKAWGCKNIAVVPNAVDVPDVQEIPHKPNLLFLGNMSHHPNTIAADYLVGSIWPIIAAALPDARLLIAGPDPEHIASFSGGPAGVEFPGFVDDLEELYKQVAVVCCPVLSGGGTRVKILEAAAYGKPVVSTTIGAEGINLRDGEEILLRDSPGSFAEACIRLLNDRSFAVEIGQNARAAVAREYDRNKVVDSIKGRFNDFTQDEASLRPRGSHIMSCIGQSGGRPASPRPAVRK
ncbi:MAG: glycosyltransferase [Syntrophobacteraceae bacterium]